MTEEESLLSVVVDIHCYYGTTCSKNDYILALKSRPSDLRTSLWRVPNDMFQLHYWVLSKLWRALQLSSNKLSANVIGLIALKSL